MFASMKSLFKWNLSKNNENKNYTSSLILIIFINILEDVLFWKKMWLSLLFFILFNIVFFICVYQELNFLQFVFGVYIIIVATDAFETWLKYKHRTSCLKRLISHDNSKIQLAVLKIKAWIEKKQMAFIYLRDRNHTKAFLLLQIILSFMLFIGKFINGYSIVYLLCTVLFFLHKLIPPLFKLLKKVQQSADSEFELEGLVPDESEINLELLSIEPDQKPVIDEKQSLDYWKPDDLPIEEASDSSDNSSSLVTNLSTEKLQTLSKDVEITDSSEDEYIPQDQQPDQQPEQFQSSLEVQPTGSWSGAAYNVLSNFGGAVANIVYKTQDGKEKRRKRVSSMDSSDGFEIIDKKDFQ